MLPATKKTVEFFQEDGYFLAVRGAKAVELVGMIALPELLVESGASSRPVHRSHGAYL
jgi:hypothetical protein